MMRNEEEQRKGKRLTMLFRRRQKSQVVKYAFLPDPSVTPTPALQDPQTIWEAWITYPAMKTCDMLRKLPSYCPHFIEQDKDLVPLKKFKNVARFNIEAWKILKSRINPNASQREYEKPLHTLLTGGMERETRTLRRCPPVSDLLTQSLVVKCPTDLHFAKGTCEELYGGAVKVMEGMEDEIVWHWHSPAMNIASGMAPWGEHHPEFQFKYGEDSQIKGYTNLKINTGLSLEMPDHITCMQSAPIFHHIKAPFTVIPGIFNYPTNKNASIIPNFFIPYEQEDFTLKKGDALMYLTFSEPVKFELNEKGSDHLIKFAFDGPQLSWRNLAKKLRYDGKD